MASLRRKYARAKIYKLSNGQKVQGTWEKAYGEWLISQSISFITQPKHNIKYKVPRTGGTHSYTPDFYLINEKKYIEITPQYSLDKQGGAKARKLRRVQEQNPEITLEILTGKELKELGVL